MAGAPGNRALLDHYRGAGAGGSGNSQDPLTAWRSLSTTRQRRVRVRCVGYPRVRRWWSAWGCQGGQSVVIWNGLADLLSLPIRGFLHQVSRSFAPPILRYRSTVDRFQLWIWMGRKRSW